jgi:hypothetical protein
MIKLNHELKVRMKNLPSEFDIEIFEKYEFPSEGILRYADSVLCLTLLNKEFLYFEEITEYREDM